MIYISLPMRLLQNNGRDEFTIIMNWLHNMGEHRIDWQYSVVSHDIGFKEIEDLTAFKLRFGV
jgi:hypothetical protein